MAQVRHRRRRRRAVRVRAAGGREGTTQGPWEVSDDALRGSGQESERIGCYADGTKI